MPAVNAFVTMPHEQNNNTGVILFFGVIVPFILVISYLSIMYLYKKLK